MLKRTNLRRAVELSSRPSELYTSSRPCLHTFLRQSQPRSQAECSKAVALRKTSIVTPYSQVRWNSSFSKPDSDYIESIFSTPSSWNQVVAEPTSKKASQSSSSRPIDLKAQEQRAFADLFDEIFKAAEVAAASEVALTSRRGGIFTSGETSTSGTASASGMAPAFELPPASEGYKVEPDFGVGLKRPAFSSEFYDSIRRTPGKPKLAHVEDEEFDKKKEEMNLCRTDYELLDWVLVDVFAEAQVYEEEARKMDLRTRNKRNITLRPSWYPNIIACLMQTFREKYQNPHTALAIFNYAKTTSIASYAFGCSTQAYNELIETYWTCFRDVNAVLDAVKEMQVNGVKSNTKTARLIDTIRRQAPTENLWSEEEMPMILARLDATRREAGGDLTSKNYKAPGMKFLDQWKVQELRDDPYDAKGFNKW